MRRIAIVGTASSGIAAPYHDKDWEIWGVSARADYVTRANRWFELHRLDGEPEQWANDWRKVLSSWIGDIPLYMFYPEPSLAKKVIQYPSEEITARFGTYFMTSTFAWMMALAIHEMRPTRRNRDKCEIMLCGVDMEAGTEYAQQRAGLRHFIDIAGVLDITVTRLADGGLAYEPIPYPMWQDDPLLNKLEKRVRETKARLELLDGSKKDGYEIAAHTRGQLAVWDNYPLADRNTTTMEIIKLDKRLEDLTVTSGSLSKEIVQLEASLAEQQWMIDFLQP